MYFMRMILPMTKKKRRRRINLTVNNDIWDLCQKKGQEYDLNWSEVAQQAFLAVLLRMQQLERDANFEAAHSPKLKYSVIQSQLKNYINREFLSIDVDFRDPLEEVEARIELMEAEKEAQIEAQIEQMEV